MLFFFFKKLEL